MKIVVLTKYVPEPTATWRFADDLTLDRGRIEGRLSELDEYAVEQALRLVEAGMPAEISYLTMGPERAVDGLRKALAMGGDSAVRVAGLRRGCPHRGDTGGRAGLRRRPGQALPRP